MAWFRFMFVSVLLLATPAFARDEQRHVRIELIAETDKPAAGGEVTLAFASTPEKGWHAYWENPGDAGLPATAEWTLPKGAGAGSLRYPVPQRLTIGGLMNYVYEAPVAQLVTIRLPAGASGTLPIKVLLDYLVCTDAICVPEKAELATTLTVGDGTISPERRSRFDSWRAALPKPLGSQGTYQNEGTVFRLAVPYPADAAAEGEAYFYPLTERVIDYAAPQKATRDGDRFVIETVGKNFTGPVEGVFAIGTGFRISASPGTVAAAKPEAASAVWLAALLAFAGAVLGGLILNIMPCVFPILSLKALSLAKANDGDGNPKGEALAYTAGVVLVCLLLGGILLALRAGGQTLGWAYQLTQPGVILLLLLLVIGIAFNLAGLFELSTPAFVNRAAAKGTGGAFATGALAAFIATPCSGPFMGVALGAALVLPWPAALAVFGGLGLGLALPFLLLGFVPSLRRLLPKPGAWMEAFRRVLSIPMFLTAIALAWVLGRQIGADGMAYGLLVTLGLALLLWALGRRQAKGLGSGFAWYMIVLVAVAGIWLVARMPPATEAKQVSDHEAFSEARLAELTAQGRPVFAYFTADWCVSCKVNEKAVIETAPVEKALADKKVAVLVGDWTNGDPALGRFIEKHNRAGVPLYLWYAPGTAEPEVLPQILSQSLIVNRARAK